MLFWWTDPFVIMKYLSLLIHFVLKFILFDINISTPASFAYCLHGILFLKSFYFWLICVFIFKVSLVINICLSFAFISSLIVFAFLIVVCSPFAFYVIFDMVVLRLSVCYFSFVISILLFLSLHSFEWIK